MAIMDWSNITSDFSGIVQEMSSSTATSSTFYSTFNNHVQQSTTHAFKMPERPEKIWTREEWLAEKLPGMTWLYSLHYKEIEYYKEVSLMMGMTELIFSVDYERYNNMKGEFDIEDEYMAIYYKGDVEPPNFQKYMNKVSRVMSVIKQRKNEAKRNSLRKPRRKRRAPAGLR